MDNIDFSKNRKTCIFSISRFLTKRLSPKKLTHIYVNRAFHGLSVYKKNSVLRVDLHPLNRILVSTTEKNEKKSNLLLQTKTYPNVLYTKRISVKNWTFWCIWSSNTIGFSGSFLQKKVFEKTVDFSISILST